MMKFMKEGREWELPDAFYRVSIKLLIKDKNDRLLVLQNKYDSFYELPGGGLDHGETIEEAIHREVDEELGVSITRLDSSPMFTEVGLHPHNYRTIKLYYIAELSSFDFIMEEKLLASFFTKDAFTTLNMPGDESPAQKHTDEIWPKR